MHRRLVQSCAVAAALVLSACAPQTVSVEPASVDTVTAVETTALPSPAPTPEASPAEEPTPSAEPSPTPSPSPSPSASPSPSGSPSPSLPPALVGLGDTGDDVRGLQHRLLQLQWFEGRITGEYDEKTKLAVEGFQGKRGIQVLGYVDQTTWDKLVAMTKEPTHNDMYNVLVPGPALLKAGAKGDAVKALQARLKQLDWYDALIDGVYGDVTTNAVKGFQDKRQIPVTGEVDQRTLDRLNSMTRKPTANELNNVVASPSATTRTTEMTLDDRCLKGKVLCISKEQRRLAWVVDGVVQDTFSVRFGSELTPTRDGVFSVYMKSKDHVSSIYHTSMPFAMFFSGGQAVHYSADFAARGYNGASHGCVNVRDKSGIAWLFDQVRVGDTVVVF